MANIDESFEVRYKKAKEMFQVLVDFERLEDFKKRPEEINVYDVLSDTKIFKDQKRGELASQNTLNEIFNNLSEEEILKEILIKGECQIPTSYLNKKREEKKRQVISYICENAINPASKMKYTPTMLESEVNKIKYNFNPNTGFEKQAEEMIKLLKKIIPISVDKVLMKIEVPAQYAGAFYGPFRQFGKIEKEYYDNSGNLRIHLEITQSQTDKVINYIKQKSNNEASYHTVND